MGVRGVRQGFTQLVTATAKCCAASAIQSLYHYVKVGIELQGRGQMEFRPFAKYRRGLASVALCSALALAIVTGAANSERMVQSGFDSALADRDAIARQSGHAAPTKTAAVPQAQSEDFWLQQGRGSASDIKPVAWTGQLGVGDRLTIPATGNGQAQVLEVVETRPVAFEATRLDLTNSAPALLAVLCRDVDRPAAPLVHFLVTEGATLPFNLVKADKAL